MSSYLEHDPIGGMIPLSGSRTIDRYEAVSWVVGIRLNELPSIACPAYQMPDTLSA